LTDHFALLGQPRRPWLDTELLHRQFLALSATTHPDRVHEAGEPERLAANQRFAALNQAYHCLRDPRERLLHLIELERGARPSDIQRLPPGTMELFLEVGQLCRHVDAFLATASTPTTPILRVSRFTQAIEWTDRLGTLLARIGANREALLAELPGLNAAWDAAPVEDSNARQRALPLEQAERLYRRLSYLGRWTAQLQERNVQLALVSQSG
jgi:curved DNA-binding protein CbpA